MAETKSQTSGRLGGLARRVLRALLAAMVLAVGAAAFLKYYLGPRLLKVKVREALSRVWAGPVRLPAAELDLSGAARLYGVELSDEAGNRWLRVHTAELGIAGLASLKPTLRRVELIGVECDMHFAGGRCRPPIRRARPAGRRGIDLDAFAARDVTVRIMQAGRPVSAAACGGLEAHLTRAGSRYVLSLTRKYVPPREALLLEATYDAATGAGTAKLSLDHTTDVAESSAIFGALGWRHLAAAQGRVSLRGGLDGPLLRPAECEHSLKLAVEDLRLDAPNGMIAADIDLELEAGNGRATLRSASAATPAGKLTLQTVPIAYDLATGSVSTPQLAGTATLGGHGDSRFWHRRLGGVTATGTVRFSGPVEYDPRRPTPLVGSLRLRPEGLTLTVPAHRPLVLADARCEKAVVTGESLELEGFQAGACGGSVTAAGRMDNWTDPSRRSFLLDLTTAAVDLGKLNACLNPEPGAKVSGRMDLDLALAGRRFGWEDLAGRGRLSVRGGDFWSVPGLGHLFGLLKLPKGPAAVSDAHAVFALTGPVVGIRRAVLSNKLAGIECTGGTVNLDTREVDVVVVGGTFLTLNKPAARLLGGVKSRLLGRRIRGRWDKIGPKDFLPLPAGEIADAPVRFLSDLARRGGKLGNGIVKGFGEVFKAIKLVPPTKPKP